MKTLLVSFAIMVAVAGGYFAWTTPIAESDLIHTPADHNPYLPMKAYDHGADFYLFNRCTVFEIVDGQKFSVPGDDTPLGCTIADPADAFKLAAYTQS